MAGVVAAKMKEKKLKEEEEKAKVWQKSVQQWLCNFFLAIFSLKCTIFVNSNKKKTMKLYFIIENIIEW